jgi:hypothetical protein
MAPIGASARSRYSALLNQVGAIYFDVAVYPPVKTSSIGLGTVYTCTPSGEIDTVDNIPSMVPSCTFLLLTVYEVTARTEYIYHECLRGFYHLIFECYQVRDITDKLLSTKRGDLCEI